MRQAHAAALSVTPPLVSPPWAHWSLDEASPASLQGTPPTVARGGHGGGHCGGHGGGEQDAESPGLLGRVNRDGLDQYIGRSKWMTTACTGTSPQSAPPCRGPHGRKPEPARAGPASGKRRAQAVMTGVAAMADDVQRLKHHERELAAAAEAGEYDADDDYWM